jgi:hypothetical protein
MNERHLLIKHGVLKEFSIRQVVPTKKLRDTCKKLALDCKTKQEFDDKIKQCILNINPMSVPGTIKFSDSEIKNNKLNIFTQNIINYFSSQKIPADEIYMILNAIAYSFHHKTLPYFEFYDESGKAKEIKENDGEPPEIPPDKELE